MRIIISPAKQMRVDTDTFTCTEPGDRCITCIFGEIEGGKVVQKGVYAKMARGEMVRFMAGIQAEEPEQLKAFNWSGYHYDENIRGGRDSLPRCISEADDGRQDICHIHGQSLPEKQRCVVGCSQKAAEE